MSKKIIDIGNGYSVRFDQRARGQETPYWVGTIFKDNKQVGRFENSGTGGSTVLTRSVEEDFERILDAEFLKQGADPIKLKELQDRAEMMIQFAEIRGYERGCSDLLFDTFIAATLSEYRHDELL